MLTALLMLAAVSRVQVVDEDLIVKANDWKFVEIMIRQNPVRVDCEYQARTAGKQVRLVLLTQLDLERMRNGDPHGFLAATEPHATGRLSYTITNRGEFVIVVMNDDDVPARVRLRVSEDFAPGPDSSVRYLSRSRQLAVIILSFVVFAGIVSWSARRLLGGIRR